MARPTRLLTIAGSDSGGGAGIQADLKTFAAHGVYGMSVITAVTAQNTQAVTGVHLVPPEVVALQIDAVFSDLGVDAIKIGMLGNRALIEVVADRLRVWSGPPVVLDPVMVAKSGDALLADDAVSALLESLVPLATLITPNLPEAERLAGFEISSAADRVRAGEELSRLGPAVLIKGGHGGGAELLDLLVSSRGVRRFVHSRIDTRSTHGTGCTLSSAIAARLGRGDELEAAVAGGIGYLQGAIAAAPSLGSGHGPVEHFPAGVPNV
ncbi:MAG: bifunctional hydroxymethylpyrimidine kinase/phosphomethylpyrimidine kinase [Thermoanaerobaculia bacterium]|nr:bifunctional hydroxymethylpyrimidine kinase/phosphomethylpyrimidine kinase [Thermoanaerobaculia bacterium]